MGLAKFAAFLITFHYLVAGCIAENQTECFDLRGPPGIFNDERFQRLLIRNLFPWSRHKVRLQFILYKRAFPVCGREIRLHDDDSLQQSGFNASHQTRITIHGFLSQSRSAFSRDVKDAYLALDDFNVIVVDWSVVSSVLNYVWLTEMTDEMGGMVADLAQHLHSTLGADFDSMYLIGHSFGAQIAGSAGKLVHPFKFNTIFAIDAAGPGFRHMPIDRRLDPSDATYVESIQTSVVLGLWEPVGHATFYPNGGIYQKCLLVGCSHVAAYKFFIESLTSPVGFWGTLCDMEYRKWRCPQRGKEYRMGGEPSQPKRGTFYVKTNLFAPFAMGRSKGSC